MHAFGLGPRGAGEGQWGLQAAPLRDGWQGRGLWDPRITHSMHGSTWCGRRAVSWSHPRTRQTTAGRGPKRRSMPQNHTPARAPPYDGKGSPIPPRCRGRLAPDPPSPRAQRAPLWPVEGGPVDATERASELALPACTQALSANPSPLGLWRPWPAHGHTRRLHTLDTVV